MKLETIKLEKAINKAYFKQSLKRADIDLFKTNMKRLFLRINQNESEEHNKNIVSDFLKNTYYKKQYEINTSGRKDLVIHKNSTSQSPVSVIIETKSPANKQEMITFDKPNAKALHEIILYYLQERLIKGNKEVKHLIITNIFEWFIFDATDFEKYFMANKSFRNYYEKWTNKDLVGTTTEWFYNEVSKPFIENELECLHCVYINFLSFQHIENVNEARIINLYKILSPEHLLKLPFANDYNRIDTGFYNELLYILGLQETKRTGKKLITRVNIKNRQSGSLLENTINIIATKHRLKHIETLKLFGETEDEQMFSIALELVITWLNRVLFLKLLEAQLIKYHKDNRDYEFINIKRIKDFDELDELFFEVLAKRPENRSKTVNEKFGDLPYLNSSLFEISRLEDNVLFIGSLKDRLTLEISEHTVLKEKNGKKRTGKLNTLEYLFEFLNAYSFASDDKAQVQDDDRTIINAAVLGLIFEKINGYKDGSYYTPSFITSGMSKEVIRKTVLQNFGKTADYRKIKSFDELKNHIDYTDRLERQKANDIIDSIKICDPAVGSGHFLVSALNEIIAVKSELKILSDINQNRIRGIKIENINDELEIIDEETSEPFQYYVNEKGKPPDEIQQIQKAIFQEKRKLIENCLYGVDINPKSVLISRLRLWIELLKNTFYTQDSNYKFLETLPNIDINIKTGNSLISLFTFNGNGINNGEIQKLKKFTKEYKSKVELYKNVTDKKVKDCIVDDINRIKNEFLAYINPNDKDYCKLKQIKAELDTHVFLFSKEDKEAWKTKQEKLVEDIKILEETIEKRKKTLYKQAFEWRFEFPEVLDQSGKFKGFDIILGNPPYGIKLKDYEKSYFNEKYIHQDYQLDTYLLFIERAFEIVLKGGFVAYIIPNTWLTNLKFKKIRKYITEQTKIHSIAHYNKYVFQEAVVDTEAIVMQNTSDTTSGIKIRIYKDEKTYSERIINQKNYHVNGETINIFLTEKEKQLCKKIEQNSYLLEDIVHVVVGVKPYQTGKGKPAQTPDMVKKRFYDAKRKKGKNYRPLLRGSDIQKYTTHWRSKIWIKYGANLAEPRFSANFDAHEKIVIRQTGDSLVATLDTQQFVCMNNLHVITASDNAKFELKYILALLNSKLLDFYHQCLNPEKGEALAEIKKQNVGILPIKRANKEKQRKIVKIVDDILKRKNHNFEADISPQVSEIDKLVYELYHLTDVEIEMIELA